MAGLGLVRLSFLFYIRVRIGKQQQQQQQRQQQQQHGSKTYLGKQPIWLIKTTCFEAAGLFFENKTSKKEEIDSEPCNNVLEEVLYPNRFRWAVSAEKLRSSRTIMAAIVVVV